MALVCKVKLVWVELQIEGDLVLVHMLLLCNFRLRSGEGFCMVGKLQGDHFDLFFHFMQKGQRA